LRRRGGRRAWWLVLEGIFFGFSFRKILINYLVPGGGVRSRGNLGAKIQ
jgi:hypothetical protein